ncbi:Dyp-type peroxidase [Protaetiibacter larvae]|uniref:Dyp-type peroxidase n=1 Tax=Protaetiibacter larvae TaxID=2592654 RepID=A0A5C1Y696_9MICO|nr:Dyp-type peroxidase [Protaetiibacter larvae]QEO09240.1 Dyp-type peroxidase [Protaetiibacter larvae]
MSEADGAVEQSETSGLSRRGLLTGAAIAGAAIAGTVAAVTGRTGRAPAAGADRPVPAGGEQQAGIQRPAIPQQHCLLAVLDLDLDALQGSLSALGTRIAEVTAQPRGIPELTPDGPADLTVTVGLGARALVATAAPELATLVELPDFAGDAELPPERRGGELLLSVNASDPTVLEPVLSSLLAALSGPRLRWTEFGYRGPAVDGVSRNPFGYFDGIIRPQTEQEFRDDVWIADGPLAGGTVCVVRRFHLGVDEFRALAPADRDAVIGRAQSTGAPLSGGSRDDQIDLDAKRADGSLLIPLHAHARAAHPSFTGSPLMLRRSYSYRASDDDRGHLFISYQNDVATFTRTQLRLDEVDDLMRYSSPTATAAFAILPGVLPDRPLGATLF